LAEALEERPLMFRTYVGGGDEDAKWSFNSLSYSYSNLLDGTISGLSAAELQSLAQESMGVWAAVAPLSFFQVRDAGPLMRDEDGAFADYEPERLPIVRWGHHNIDGPGNILAHALPPGDKGQKGDVHIDSASTFTDTGGNTGLLQTAVHEIGHALGMDHANGDAGGGVCPPALGVIMDACAGSFAYNGPGSAFLTPRRHQRPAVPYGQGLGYVINLSGDLHVYATGVGDLMTANVSGNNITVTSEIRGLSSSARSFTRPINNGQTGVTSIHLHGMNGDDILRPSSLRFYGGLDQDALEVVDNSNVPSAYRFDNRRAGNVATSSGAGGGAGDIHVSLDATDRINLYGGGADTVTFDFFRTGTPVGIYTRGGDDTMVVTPTSRNLAASVTNIAAFTFDGGGGGTGDNFTLLNQNSNGDWVYTRHPDRLHAAGPNGYSMTFGLAGHEATTVSAGSGADRFVLPASDPAHVTTFNGGGGGDVIELGGAPPVAGGAGVAAATVTIAAALPYRARGKTSRPKTSMNRCWCGPTSCR
jgi:hypothetical protein